MMVSRATQERDRERERKRKVGRETEGNMVVEHDFNYVSTAVRKEEGRHSGKRGGGGVYGEKWRKVERGAWTYQIMRCAVHATCGLMP
jgi:hypothetical protein